MAAVDVLAALLPLLGYDLRHSQQKCQLQYGVPLEQSGRLAAHTSDECKKYANSSYKADAAGVPIKLVSQEWSAKDALPAPLAPGGSIFGVPYDDALFSGAAAVAVAAQPQAAPAAELAQTLASMEGSLAQMQGFIASFAGLPDLDRRLHAPVLGGGSTQEQLPVKPLSEFEGTLHLLSVDLPEFLGRLPRVSVAGLAAPAAGRLVRPELAAVYSGLAAEVAQLSGRLGGGVEAGVAVPTLRLQHYSQVTFGRLDLALAAGRDCSRGPRAAQP